MTINSSHNLIYIILNRGGSAYDLYHHKIDDMAYLKWLHCDVSKKILVGSED